MSTTPFVLGRAPAPAPVPALGDGAARAASTRRSRRAAAFPARSTVLAGLCALLPVWYLLGVLAFLWAVPAVVLGGWLLTQRSVVLPRGTGLLAGLLVVMAVSALQLRSLPSVALFGYRWLIFASTAVVLVWVATVPETLLPSRRLAGWLALAWVWLVAFGYAALVLRGWSVPSPVQLLLPTSLRNEPYLHDLTVVRLAEVQSWLGFPLPRPAAPFAYANGWGSALGLLTPFFVHCWVLDARGRRRRVGIALLLAAVPPVVVSMNRGLWLSLGIVLVVYAVRAALDGDRRLLVATAGLGLAIAVVVFATPLWDLVDAKFANAADSNAARTSVYDQALDAAMSSPLVGVGSPRRASDALPLVGTQGMLWYLLYSHGVVAVGLFVGWLGGVARRAAALRSPLGVAAFATVLVGLVQVPFYGLLPQLPILGVAAGVCWRERQRAGGRSR